MKRKSVVFVVALSAAIATTTATAIAGPWWFTGSWKAAQHHVGFALRRPASVFHLTPEHTKLIEVTACPAPHHLGVVVWAVWGHPPTTRGPRRAEVALAQTNVNTPYWPCSNGGLAGVVTTATIRGYKARVDGACTPVFRARHPLPACSSRWVVFDLAWREGSRWLLAESYGIHYQDLITWARGLQPVAGAAPSGRRPRGAARCTVSPGPGHRRGGAGR